ncbi:MAG TPA: MaoC family dehydratase [Gaiellaceae bacterium]
MRVVNGIGDLETLVGEELGASDWHEITQERVNAFADATGDHQWIHVDPVRAAAGPFGVTIAHGYLTLSMLPALMGEVWRVEGVRMSINYGLNRVRFPSPVHVGARVRVIGRLKEISPVDGGVQGVVETTVEIEGGAKPAAVAETVFRLVV